jgi:DNA-binding NtrC family response regulator
VDAPLLRAGSREGNGLVLAGDPAVSRLHFEIEVDAWGHRLRDLGSTNGTFVDGYRVGDLYLQDGSRIRVGGTEIAFGLTGQEREVPAQSGDRFGPLFGVSVAMREVFALLGKVAPTDATVLVEGETGTGKELVAQALHDESKRRGGPFVVLDCASVAANLLESELFGHEKGAFTGATERRVGRLEEADGGTLFIDELGELPLELQPKLLRVLETREVRRLGGRQVIPVDLRVVAATHRDLAREVNEGTFREDLYYRLAVVRVRVPPLRERREDIPGLVAHFIRRGLAGDPARGEALVDSLSPATRDRLLRHPWPGNVRELRNVVERSLALSGDAATRLDGLDPPTVRAAAGGAQAGVPNPVGSGSADAAGGSGPPVDLDRPFVDQKAEVLAGFEKAYLTGQLERHGGNFSRAAAASGLDRMYFKRLLKKYT